MCGESRTHGVEWGKARRLFQRVTYHYNFLIAMMYTQLFETLYHRAETSCKGKRLPVHVRFLLDEFANVGTIPDFPQKLSTMRKYEISCSIIIQALSQLKAMYKDDWGATCSAVKKLRRRLKLLLQLNITTDFQVSCTISCSIAELSCITYQG